MNPLTILLILLLLVASWWLVRQRRASSAEDVKPDRSRSSANTKFHAVSIKIGGFGCKAARDLAGRRFLATEAPKLPLPGCTSIDCGCKFAHYPDRRMRKDRRSPFAPSGLGGGTGAYEAEQRTKDRRKHHRPPEDPDDDG